MKQCNIPSQEKVQHHGLILVPCTLNTERMHSDDQQYNINNCFLSPGYTMAKFGMSMCVLGMSEELKDDGIAVNALWPKTGKK